MRRTLLPIAMLVLLLGAAWWLLGVGGPEPQKTPAGLDSERAAPPAAGTLDHGSPATAEAPGEGAGAPLRETIEAGQEENASPATIFRGRLRVVKGSLSLVPDLESWTNGSPDGMVTRAPLRVDPDTHTFELAVHGEVPGCKLLLPDLLRPVAANGTPLDDSRFVPLAALPVENVIEVEVRPHLSVQFLHDPSDRPLAEGYVNTALESEGSSTSWGGRLDTQGRTFFDLKRLSNMEHAETLQFTVSWPPEIGSSEAAPIPVADIELLPQPLILRFGGTPTLHFRVVDSRREPVADARVRLSNDYSTEGRSDEDGRVAVMQSSPAASKVRVQADGFLTVHDPLTAAAEQSAEGQEVMLWPGSWIEITGHEKPPEGWGQIDVQICFDGEADASLLMPQRFQTGQFTVSSGGTGTTLNRQKRSYEHTTSLSSQGKVKLDGIHVDVPATVLLTYRGAILIETRVPIRPGDGGHELEVPPLPETLEVRGRVTDLVGHPLAGVDIQARLGGRDSVRAETDADGEYRLGRVPLGQTVNLWFTKPGFAGSPFEHHVEPGEESVVRTVALDLGRRVVLRILDADGAPLTIESDHGLPFAWWNERKIYPAEDPDPGLGPGEWLFTDLPSGVVEFLPPHGRALGGPEHHHDTATPLVTIRLTMEQSERFRRDG